jgi:hypothetical protein
VPTLASTTKAAFQVNNALGEYVPPARPSTNPVLSAVRSWLLAAVSDTPLGVAPALSRIP